MDNQTGSGGGSRDSQRFANLGYSMGMMSGDTGNELYATHTAHPGQQQPPQSSRGISASLASLNSHGGGGGGGGGGGSVSAGGGGGGRSGGGGGMLSVGASACSMPRSAHKRTSSDMCYDHQDSIVSARSMASSQGGPGGGGGGSGAGGGGINVINVSGGDCVPENLDETFASLSQPKKSPPSNGKKTKGRVKIKMEYIDNKLRRYTTFSKRKTGIMKKVCITNLVILEKQKPKQNQKTRDLLISPKFSQSKENRNQKNEKVDANIPYLQIPIQNNQLEAISRSYRQYYHRSATNNVT